MKREILALSLKSNCKRQQYHLWGPYGRLTRVKYTPSLNIVEIKDKKNNQNSMLGKMELKLFHILVQNCPILRLAPNVSPLQNLQNKFQGSNKMIHPCWSSFYHIIWLNNSENPLVSVHYQHWLHCIRKIEINLWRPLDLTEWNLSELMDLNWIKFMEFYLQQEL